jgi:hypothetical protein
MADLGTVTVIEETFSYIKKIAFSWLSEDGGGDAGKATLTTEESYTGEIIRLVTVPSAAPDAPTDHYDVVVNDEDGNDVLMGAGADRSDADTEQVLASSLGCVANDQLSLSITSAGNAKKGTVYLYIR